MTQISQITQQVDDLPSDVPTRDNPDDFTRRGDIMMTKLPPMVYQIKGTISQLNIVVGEINIASAAIALAAQSASTSETNAAAHAQAAITAAASAVNAPGTSTTSTTSLSLTAGTKELAVAANKTLPVGASVKICRTSDVSKWMIASVVTYNSVTGALNVLVDANDINGSGTFADWMISVSGHRGAPAAVPTPALPIGAVAAFHGQNTNPVVLADGTTWLRSGTVALSATYPNAVKNMYADAGGDVGAASSPIFYANGRWIIGLATFISVSTDMKTWTRYYHSMGNAPTTVAFDGVYYIFSVGKAAYRTTDFVTFANYMKLPESFAVIKRANGVLFGMIGYGDYVYTSANGSDWTKRTLPNAQVWKDVAWTGLKYVLVGASTSACAVSVDLISWAAGGEIGCGGAYSVAYGANTLVVAMNNSYSYSTNSGTTWTTAAFSTMSVAASYSNVAWTGTKFIASSYGGSVAFAMSNNGVNWVETANNAVAGQAGDSSMHGQGGNLLSNAGGCVVMTSYGYRYVSADHGATWCALNRYDPRIECKVAGNANKAVQTLSNTSRIALLERAGNSLAFTSRYITTPLAAASYVAFSGTAWVICNANGSNIVRSTDGVTWSLIAAGFAGGAGNDRNQILAAIPNCFISITGRRSMDDGMTWGDVAIPVSVNSIAAKGGTFVATTGTATYYTSIDNGTTWIQRTAPASFDGMFDGNYWLIPITDFTSPTGAYLYSSSDGVNWIQYAAPADINPTYFNVSSVVVGILGQCLIIGYSGGYPLMYVMTKDGGATWKFGSSPSQYGSQNYQTLWGGYGSSWSSLNVDYCGLDYRRNMMSLDNGNYASSATYYQRVA